MVNQFYISPSIIQILYIAFIDLVIHNRNYATIENPNEVQKTCNCLNLPNGDITEHFLLLSDLSQGKGCTKRAKPAQGCFPTNIIQIVTYT